MLVALLASVIAFSSFLSADTRMRLSAEGTAFQQVITQICDTKTSPIVSANTLRELQTSSQPLGQSDRIKNPGNHGRKIP